MTVYEVSMVILRAPSLVILNIITISPIALNNFNKIHMSDVDLMSQFINIQVDECEFDTSLRFDPLM